MRLMIKVRRLGYITTNAIIMICGSACASKDNLINIKDNLYILPALHDDSNESGLESLVIGKKKGKPLIIVLPGSGYYPIAYHAPDSNHYYTFHPDIISNTTKYNFLIVSKPHIPALAEWDEINPDTKTYMFNNDGELFGQYSNKNTIEHYVENLPKIIWKIRNQLAPSEVILMGHSQGARIVAEMTNMRDIAKFVYLSASPLGRLFYAGVDSPAYDQILSMETSQTELERNFEKGDSYQTWRSFSYSPLVPIATTTKPFLIVYGSEDRSCVYCDAFFSLKWKNPNISLIKYEGLDHVFNDSNQNSHWKIVMADIDEWIENKR